MAKVTADISTDESSSNTARAINSKTWSDPAPMIIFSSFTAYFEASAFFNSNIESSGYKCALVALAAIAFATAGLVPIGFSFEANFTTSSGAIPYSRTTSSMGFPAS